jgi:type II secretion system protein N
MKNFFSNNKKYIGYTLYGVILAIALLIYRFPSETVKDYFLGIVHSKNPDIYIAVEKTSLALPFSLKLTGVECRMQSESGQTILKTKDILVRPGLLSLFTKNPGFHFICNAYDGTITGSVNLQNDGPQTIYDSSIEFKNIIIKDNSPLPAFIKDYVGGVLEGTISYHGAGIDDDLGSGEASLTLSGGSVKLQAPFLNIKSIDFQEVIIKADLKDQILNVPNLNLKSDDFLGQASGAITLKKPTMKSLIGFVATMEPTANSARKSTGGIDGMNLIKQSLKNGKISFALQGTIEQPVFRLR